MLGRCGTREADSRHKEREREMNRGYSHLVKSYHLGGTRQVNGRARLESSERRTLLEILSSSVEVATGVPRVLLAFQQRTVCLGRLCETKSSLNNNKETQSDFKMTYKELVHATKSYSSYSSQQIHLFFFMFFSLRVNE